MPRSARTWAVSAPRSGATDVTERACGAATASPAGVRSVGPPARCALTAAMEISRSRRPPERRASRQAPAAVETRERVGDGVDTEERTVVGPRDEAAGGGGVVAERDPVGVLARAAVARDGHPDLGPAVGDDLRAAVDAELCQRAGAAGLDHDVGPSDQCPEDAGVTAALQVEADGTLPPVQEVEECAGAAACAVGSLRRLDLHHGGARPGQEIAAQRPRPEGGEVDHDEARHVGSRRRFAESFLEDCVASIRSCGLPDEGDRQPEQPGPLHQDLRVAISELCRHRGPHGGRRCRHRVELEPGRHHFQVLVAGQRHGQEAVRAAQQPATPPAARGPPSPQAHGRGPFAQECECVQSRERPGEPIDPFHQALRRSERLVGPSGERHGPAVRPALHPGVVHVGRVTSRDPRTSERRSIARRTAQRDPS